MEETATPEASSTVATPTAKSASPLAEGRLLEEPSTLETPPTTPFRTLILETTPASVTMNGSGSLRGRRKPSSAAGGPSTPGTMSSKGTRRYASSSLSRRPLASSVPASRAAPRSPASTSRASPYLLTVLPPTHLPHDPPHPRTSAHSAGYGPPEHFRRGTLIPLQPTLSAQLAAIAREYSLPSTAGIVLYLLSVSDASAPGAGMLVGEDGPRVGEEAWRILWSYLDWQDLDAHTTEESGLSSEEDGQQGKDEVESLLEEPQYASRARFQQSMGHLGRGLPSSRSHRSIHSMRYSSAPPTPSAPRYGGNVVVGKVEFDIDLRSGGKKWYEAWRSAGESSSHTESLLPTPPSTGGMVSPTSPKAPELPIVEAALPPERDVVEEELAETSGTPTERLAEEEREPLLEKHDGEEGSKELVTPSRPSSYTPPQTFVEPTDRGLAPSPELLLSRRALRGNGVANWQIPPEFSIPHSSSESTILSLKLISPSTSIDNLGDLERAFAELGPLSPRSNVSIGPGSGGLSPVTGLSTTASPFTRSPKEDAAEHESYKRLEGTEAEEEIGRAHV